MNRNAIQLAISTLILIILAVLVLLGLTYSLTNGFQTFQSSTDPFQDTTQASSIKAACSLAGNNLDKITYCCKEYNIDESEIKCSDPRLELGCNLDCTNFKCE
jgi:hypothetical protein